MPCCGAATFTDCSRHVQTAESVDARKGHAGTLLTGPVVAKPGSCVLAVCGLVCSRYDAYVCPYTSWTLQSDTVVSASATVNLSIKLSGAVATDKHRALSLRYENKPSDMTRLTHACVDNMTI